MKNQFLRRFCCAAGMVIAAAGHAYAQDPGQATQQPAAPTQTPAQAPAQPPAPPVLPDVASPNVIEFGLRGTNFAEGSDEARFQRYRDLRNGATLDLVSYTRDAEQQGFAVHAYHVGYRDQHYAVDYNRYGKLKMSFDWNQIPLFYSEDTATLYSFTDPATLRIDDAIQQGIQHKTLTLANAVTQAQPFELRSQRDVLNFNLDYSATPHLDLSFLVRNTKKDGNQPWDGTFGFGNAVEFPVPIDTHTTDIGTALQWANDRGVVKVGYDGSFFRNNNPTIVWDNPLQFTDTTAAPGQGRESLWPDSNMNAVSGSGVLNLGRNTHATAYLSVGDWSQDNILIPFTINSALPVIPLDRATSDVQATVTAQAYTFSSRPSPQWWFTAQYRSYDFNNTTPVFHLTQTVAYDTSVETFDEGGTSPASITRRKFDGEASYSPWRHSAFRLGYTHQNVDETFRTFDTTAEDTGRVSADLTGLPYVSVRAVYEHGKRVGSGLDEQALDDIGEQVSLRQFDISNRVTDRFSTIVQAMPLSTVSVTFTGSVGREDRPDTGFGLLSNDNHAVSFGVDYVPRDSISMGIEYQIERYDTLQQSRQANPGPEFDDPTRDWTTSGGDDADTLFASIDLLKLFANTDVRFGYNYSHATTTYVYGVPPDSTLKPPQQLPAVVNTLNRATFDASRRFKHRWMVVGSYWFDKYTVDDFAMNPSTLNSLAQPSFMILGYVYRPYTAHTFMARVGYLW
jgi:MtrB/PioB family decaheme-associated outer membrane protein